MTGRITDFTREKGLRGAVTARRAAGVLLGLVALAGCAASPLRLAAMRGDLQNVRSYVEERGMSLEEAGFCCDSGPECTDANSTPLGCAAYKGHIEIMKYLLSKGAQADAGKDDVNFKSPLVCAAKGNSLEAVELLLENGAWVDAPNSVTNRTALSYCVFKDSNRDIVKLLLSKGADPNVSAKFPDAGFSARSRVSIIEAARKGAPDIASLMEQYASAPRRTSAPASSAAVRGGGLISAGGKSVLAVTNLEAQSASSGDAAVVADWLRGGLVATGAFTVVEKNNMDKVLSEQAFQQTGCTSDECAVKLGKILNVQLIVVGSLGKFMGATVLNVRVVDVETGKVIYADKAKGNTADEVESAVTEMCARMAGGGKKSSQPTKF